MPKKIKKILIANRGEITVRIIRACRDAGIISAAVFSECDRTALHVRLADEAYFVGPSPSIESYLVQENIIKAAKRAKADAIHPGYGFLAENPDFAEAVVDAGLAWIGPPPDIIRIMGNKVAARETIARAGVPLVPGTSHAKDLRDDELVAAAYKLGFPLLVKAAGGGGGKGIREVNRIEGLAEAVRVARREAHSAFGDDRIYLVWSPLNSSSKGSGYY